MQAVQRAVQIAERGGGTSPTSDAEAAKGRLDYVQVRRPRPSPSKPSTGRISSSHQQLETQVCPDFVRCVQTVPRNYQR